MNCLLVVFSYHHRNTNKVAQVFAEVLDAQIKTPQEVDIEEFQECGLVGFGSGIYSAKHHKSVLELADRLPSITDRNAFIFSTFGGPAKLMEGDKSEFERYVADNHSSLRAVLQSKGYTIVGEFSCAGFNTNSFLRFLGGMNKGRPNAKDLKQAEEFAQDLKQYL